MTYYFEAWKLRDAVNALRNHSWDGSRTVQLNRLRQRLNTVLEPMDLDAREKVEQQQLSNQALSDHLTAFGRQALDETPTLPEQPLVQIAEIENLPAGIITGEQLEILQGYGVVESDGA